MISLQEATRLGATLRRIDPSLLKNGEVSVWFKGGEPYFDVSIELAPADKTIVWFQVTFRGRSLTWKNDNAHVRTGTTNEFDIQAGMPQSKGISVDAQTDLEFVHVARALLGAQAHEPLLLAAQQALKLPESEKP